MKVLRVMAAVLALNCAAVVLPASADEVHDLAYRLMDLMRLQDLIEQQQKQMRTALMPQIKEMIKGSVPGDPKEVEAAMQRTRATEDKVFALLTTELSWDNLKADYADLYAKTFSASELKELVAFYQSPAGKALVAKQPELVKGSMALGQRKMAELMPRFQQLMRESLANAAAPTPGSKKKPSE